MPRPARTRSPRSSRRLPDAEERAADLALKALARRELTAAELEVRLSRRGFEPEVVRAVVERVQDAGGVDDERYARLFAEDKRRLEGWGEDRIRAALEARGVEGPLIDRALGTVTHDGELARALELLERRGEAVADEASRGRAYGFLVRRGYPSEVAYDAVRRAEAPTD
jgi:regulatory protein